MGQVIDALKELFNSQLIIANGEQHSDVQLHEADRTAKLKKLTLTGIESNMLCLSPDAGRKIKAKNNKTITICMSPLFSTTSGYDHNRACDALLLREQDNGTCDFIYIELKSDFPNGYEGQFKSTACFVRYICELVNKLYEVKMQIGRERFVVFHTDKNNTIPSIQKRGKRTQTNEPNQPHNPDKYIVRNKASIPISKIF